MFVWVNMCGWCTVATINDSATCKAVTSTTSSYENVWLVGTSATAGGDVAFMIKSCKFNFMLNISVKFKFKAEIKW